MHWRNNDKKKKKKQNTPQTENRISGLGKKNNVQFKSENVCAGFHNSIHPWKKICITVSLRQD